MLHDTWHTVTSWQVPADGTMVCVLVNHHNIIHIANSDNNPIRILDLRQSLPVWHIIGELPIACYGVSATIL